ncbi:acyltransferase family protein [Intestinibacter bartlettii]|uniref:Acyltransferase family protein n=1 Tax=Intestinibacter bartlettii TaxID=261299 RepID=A0ABS6DZQ4_9FIRM|nr:acyltransferase family protein [Intestinibacter bartlettii]MBU5337326.1 acyltransferase family protein [Intestinibacter bartlettii]
MEKTKNERLEYLDICKGFGIFAITLGHIYSDNYFKTWLCSFHLPLFFIISGILIKHTSSDRKKFGNILSSRFKRLIIPYFMFELLVIIVLMICNKEVSFTILKQNIIESILLYTKAGATWFLPTLFISELVFLGLKKLIKSNKLMVLISTIIFIIPFFIHTENHFSIVFFRNFTAIGFLAFGYYSYNFLIKKEIPMKYLIMILLIDIIISILNGKVDLYFLSYNNIFLYSICSITGSVLVIFISKKLKSIKIRDLFKYYGINSLIVMATQQAILGSVIKLITGKDAYSYSIPFGTIVLIMVMLIEIPTIEVVNRYLPFMLGNFKKRKKDIVLKTE